MADQRHAGPPLMVQAVLVMVVAMTVVTMVIAIVMANDRAGPSADHRARRSGDDRAGRCAGYCAFSGVVDGQGAVRRRQDRQGARKTQNSIHFCLSKKRYHRARRTPKCSKALKVPSQVRPVVNRGAP